MTTRQLCGKVAKRLGLKRDDIHPVFLAIAEEMKEALERGDPVHIPKLGEIYPGRFRKQWWPRFRPYDTYMTRFRKNFVENRDAESALD